MLNPSDADAYRNDPTIRRCIGFARAWGYGGVDVANLYGLVSKDPKVLWRHRDPVGPDNDRHLAAVCRDTDLTVLAWGAGADAARAHVVAAVLWRLAVRHGGSLAVLGWTLGAQPRHPLFVPKDTTPECLTLAAAGCGLHEAEDRRWEDLLAGAA